MTDSDVPTPDGERESEAVLRFVQRRCAEILELPRVELQDNFFDLGGDSLSAMELVGDCEEHFDVAVDLQWLFDATSLGDFSIVLNSKLTNEMPHQGSPGEIT